MRASSPSAWSNRQARMKSSAPQCAALPPTANSQAASRPSARATVVIAFGVTLVCRSARTRARARRWSQGGSIGPSGISAPRRGPFDQSRMDLVPRALEVFRKIDLDPRQARAALDPEPATLSKDHVAHRLLVDHVGAARIDVALDR